jgi:hypothetical protein
MEEQLRLESSEQIRIRRKRLERNENRIAELKRLFIRIYEDNACGRLSDERFDSLPFAHIEDSGRNSLHSSASFL